MNIYFDHAYTDDKHHKFLKQLSRLGFKVDKDMTEHPGLKCRFILFQEKGYLEFVHPQINNKRIKSPGISFGSKGKLKSLNQSYKKRKLSTTFTHRNYKWKDDNKTYLPGWNFLKFDHLPVKSFYPWFTEYEVYPGLKKKKTVEKKHPNSVSGIIALEFEVNKKGEAFFEKLLGQKLKDKILLKNSLFIHFKRNCRSNRFSKIILKAKNFKTAQKYMKKEELTVFNNQDAILIKNPSSNKKMWDLLVV